MLMLDLFSGLGGASRAMVERGWDVITVDCEPRFAPTVCCDLREYHYDGPRPDLVWASPPCTEFSKTTLPARFYPNRLRAPQPDTELLEHTLRVIGEADPRYWVIENVRGAIPYFEPYLGPVKKKSGSRYLWGEFPIFDCQPQYGKRHVPRSPDRAAIRALIPYQMSKALAMAVERASIDLR